MGESLNEIAVETLSMLDTVKNNKTAGDVAHAFAAGAEQGTAGELNRQAVKLVLDYLGDRAPEAFHTPEGRKSLEVLIPLLTIAMADVGGHLGIVDKIPGGAKGVGAARAFALLGFQDAVRAGAGDAVQIAVEFAGPLIGVYAAGAAGVDVDSGGK